VHRFRILRDLNLVVMEFGERLNDQGLLDHLLTVYEHPGFLPGMDEISSFLRTRVVDVTPAGLREIARTFPRRHHESGPANAVAVVARTQLARGLTRLYGAYAGRGDGHGMDVFPTVAAAGDWLDRQRDRAPGTTAAQLTSFTLERQ
jgi:hypothetical protein